MAELRCAVCGRVNYFDDDDRWSRRECRDCGEELAPPAPSAAVGETSDDVPPALARRGDSVGLLGLFLGGVMAYATFFAVMWLPLVAVVTLPASGSFFYGGQMARGSAGTTRTVEGINKGIRIVTITGVTVLVGAVACVALLMNR